MTDTDRHDSLVVAHETRLQALLDGDWVASGFFETSGCG